MFQLKTFREVYRPLHFMNLLIGMGCFEYSGEKRAWKLAEIVYAIVYSILAAYAGFYIQSELLVYCTLTKELMAWFLMSFRVNSFLSILLIIVTRVKIESLRSAIKLIETSDQRMENMGLSMHRSMHYKEQINLLVVCGAVFVGFTATTCHWQLTSTMPMHIKIILGSATYLPLILITTCDVTFYFWIRYLSMKFYQLNSLLRTMLTTTIDSPMHKRILKLMYDFEMKRLGKENIHVANGNANTMRAVKQIHLQLIKTARTINDYYGTQVLFITCNVFGFLTMSLFFAYKILFSDLTNERFQSHFSPLALYVLFYMSKLVIVNHVCIKTSNEALDTGDLVCELYEPSTSKEFRAEIRDFILQMIQNPLVFTACGFFDLDNTFIHGLVGTIGTYLVILIQVSEIDIEDDSVANATMSTTTVTMI
ncbi:putative gustatory receptor 28b isoform X1 [Nomia melanderi]|uniref:putative gustatory receptor 28b isoform X1 n=1 Tax=Nomia melanderi TaxID=2448451 RepID=UPI001304062C|nr:putative gustatory receptor 28b isoform X2 [Nomia melanderi]